MEASDAETPRFCKMVVVVVVGRSTLSICAVRSTEYNDMDWVGIASSTNTCRYLVLQ